jgi:hypothetical protein
MKLSARLLFATCLLFPSLAHAWSNKEHMQLARLAAERLIADPKTPPEMKAWLRKGVLQPMDIEAEKKWFMEERIGLITRTADPLPYWATRPDMMVMADLPSKKQEPWGVHERDMHFVDLEYFYPDPAKRTYVDDLSHKPEVKDFPDDPKDPRWSRSGMLPFRVRQCYENLVAAMKAGRLADEPGKYPHDEHALKWAGYLAHYAADNTQPQHATADYKSAVYFPGVRKPPNVHAEMEYRMCDDEYHDFADLRAEFWPLFIAALEKEQDPQVDEKDLFRATLQVSLASYDALPMIGRSAKAATKDDLLDTRAFFHGKGTYRGREMTVMQMKAIQSAWAVKRIEALLLRAWKETHP